ncbi:basal body protein 10-like [Miscanthus floridulus]|uniref:basal body protein 10-like n=1 Tax=Miscanthus floridulus TaxID=154761 RepID=UPI00345956FC
MANVMVLPVDQWDRSNVTVGVLQSLVDVGLLRPITDPSRPEWMAPGGEPEPRPRDGYVVSFVSFHERGFGLLVDRFMQALPHYYGVELHNFNPNSIIWFYLRNDDGGLPPYTGRVVEVQPKHWWYGVPSKEQHRLRPLLKALERLHDHGLTAAVAMAAFHRRRVLPLMARRRRLFEMTPDKPIDGIRMSAMPLSDEEGMRDIRASPPPVPEDTQRRAANRAYAEAQKKKKDAKMAKRKKKIVERDALEKHCRKQKLEGLPVEASPSTSVEDSSDDDGGEVERGPLDRLPNVREMVLGASAGGPASQGGGGDGDSGQMSALPVAEADTPKTRVLGKRAVSPLGSTAEVEQAAAGPAPPGVERAPESDEGRPASADTGAAPPPLLQRRDAVKKQLGIRSGKKRQAEVPAFAPRKALKVGTGSIAPGVVEVQELVAQVGATQAAVGQEEEEEPTLREAAAPAAVEATVGVAETPLAMEATEGEVEVKAPTVAEALRTSGAEVVEIAAPGNFRAEVVEEAGVSAARAANLKVGTEARWDHPRVWWRSRDDPEGEPIFALEDAVEGGRWDTLEQYHSLAERSLQTALSIMANDLLGVSQELEAWSFGKSLFLQRERGVWDELCRQRELLAHANELLSARSVEVEDLRLCYDNREAEVATAQGQVAPLVAWVKELEEELARVADERDASNSRAEEVRATAIATAGQLGAEQQAHELMKGALAEATKAAEASQGEALKWREKAKELEKEASRAAEASRVEVQRWKEKAKGLDDEVSRLTEASVALQTVLDHEIEEHEVLQSAARAIYEALEMEGVQSGSSLRSRLTALIGQARQRLREALHTGVKRALAVVSSHYAGIDVEGISDGYVLSEDAIEAEEELTKLEAAVEGPGTVLAKLFKEEVVPPSPSFDARDPAP